ncbi:hypothetical protein [Spiroplasma endosymbiont of Cantharis lateralis]|uniref:hypothetical protein n=1 Tax=Spiroplasma endosymbiont of Cantharis lateralis TaxID=3066277 RepID=UPI00313B20E1
MVEIINEIKVNFSHKDKEDYLKYVEIIGKKIINFLIFYFCKKRNTDSLNYKNISDLIRYDKRIKYNVFRFLNTIEDKIKQKLIDNTIYYKKFEIANNSEDFTTLNELNELDSNYYTLGTILKELKKLKLIDDLEEKNFKSVLELRNKIVHFTLIYTNLEWFTKKLYELKNLLPEDYQKGYIKVINESKKQFKIVSDLLIEDLK